MSSAKSIEPQLGLDSFSCPHCGAIAHQTWFRVFLGDHGRGEGPLIYVYPENFDPKKIKDEDQRDRTAAFFERLRKNDPTVLYHPYENVNWELVNVFISHCYSCDGYAVWVKDKLLFPAKSTTVVAHEDMPADVREIFEEAASIVDLSSRGAAALMRLAIQKLMPALGEKGKDLNQDIGSLVKQGLEVEVQQALDVVRVIGNNAVHPGVIDLKDDKATALKLFELVNIIVERRISTPKRIAALFKDLPSTARDQISKRDGKP